MQLEWYDERGADIRRLGGARVEQGASLSLSTPVSAECSAKSSLGRSANAMGAAWNSRGGLASEHAYTVPEKWCSTVVQLLYHTHNTAKVPSAEQASSVVCTTLVSSHAQKTSIT